MTSKLLEQFFFWVHGLSGAAWFGGIFYRTFVVDAKALAFFPRRADYEHFSTHLAHNMRYFVIAGLLTCGLSGFALVGLKWDGASEAWLALMTAKAAVWLGACGLFTYVSWVNNPHAPSHTAAFAAISASHASLAPSHFSPTSTNPDSPHVSSPAITKYRMLCARCVEKSS